MSNYLTPQKLSGTTTQMIPNRFNQRLGYKKVMCFALSHFGDNLFSCQVKWVNAHAQSVPPLVHDLQKLLLLKNSTRMGCPVVALFYPKMRKCLPNASDLPLMSRVVMPFKS